MSSPNDSARCLLPALLISPTTTTPTTLPHLGSWQHALCQCAHPPHTQPSGFLLGLANGRSQNKGRRRVSSGYLYSRFGFSRQEYWSGLPCPPPGDLPNPGIRTQVSCIAGGFFTIWATREAFLPLNLPAINCLSLSFLRLKIFSFFSSHYVACGILVPWPGIKPVPPAVEAQSPNHWITREVH